MALRSDELEENTFFRTLQLKYKEKFILAQRKNWIICIPCQNSLNGVYVSRTVIENHILKPSPYFKGHYISTDANESGSFEIEDKVIRLAQGKGEVKILMEEKGYNEDYKPYRILVIEHPLNKLPQNKKDHCTVSFGNSVKDASSTHQSDHLNLLQSYPEHLRALDRRIAQFNTSYMVLPDYLHEASVKLQSLVEWALETFMLPYGRNSNPKEISNSELSVSIESYILSKVHSKIYPIIRKLLAEEDKEISSTLFALYESGFAPDQLGVKDHFCCHTPSAVVELASLNSKATPTEKLICLITTLELLNQDIENSMQSTFSFLNHGKDIPCLSSDDLIPLLVNVLVQARPLHLASNLYYVQNFNWHFSTMDKASFCLVTFQAAKEFICSNACNMSKPSTSKVKQQMTLEELIKMTVDIQNNKDSSISKEQSLPTTIDNQLENVTRMIEASTKDLQQWSLTKEEKICLHQKDSYFC